MLLPILYSFRRCPYAIRAGMALRYGNIDVEHREITLKNKPASLLAYSPKGTVPVLVLPEGKVIDESLDIMYWVLAQSDPEHWNSHATEVTSLINTNDNYFKTILDQYKYPKDKDIEQVDSYWQQAYTFLTELEVCLKQHRFLCDERPNLADFAIFPFVRQFAKVDWERFCQAALPKLQAWLNYFLQADIFQSIMQKHALWQGE